MLRGQDRKESLGIVLRFQAFPWGEKVPVVEYYFN